MKRVLVSVAVLALLGWVVPSAKAGTITYALTDIGTFGGFTDGNTSDTFTGSGFVGIYPTFSTDFGSAGPNFVHLFGLENYNGIFSETESNVNISALQGQHINSATLSYVLLDGGGGSQTVTVTRFTANGTLSFNMTPPNNLGSTSFTSNGLSANSADVTALVAAAVASGDAWLGLYLTPNGPGDNGQWTYTSGFGGDEALFRLTVDFSPIPVPEPASLTLFGLAMLAGGYCVRRRRRSAISQSAA